MTQLFPALEIGIFERENHFPLNYYLGKGIKLWCHWLPQKSALFWNFSADSDGDFLICHLGTGQELESSFAKAAS